MEPTHCILCDTPITRQRSDARGRYRRYCSDRCRYRANYWLRERGVVLDELRAMLAIRECRHGGFPLPESLTLWAIYCDWRCKDRARRLIVKE